MSDSQEIPIQATLESVVTLTQARLGAALQPPPCSSQYYSMIDLSEVSHTPGARLMESPTSASTISRLPPIGRNPFSSQEGYHIPFPLAKPPTKLHPQQACYNLQKIHPLQLRQMLVLTKAAQRPIMPVVSAALEKGYSVDDSLSARDVKNRSSSAPTPMHQESVANSAATTEACRSC